MAKKRGKKNQKKGIHGRDWASFGGYFVVLGFIAFLVLDGMKGSEEVKELEKRYETLKKQQTESKKQNKTLVKDLKQVRAEFENSKSKFKREEEEYKFVVGTSLEYAEKNKLLMAVWEAIGVVRNVAIRNIKVEKNDVTIEMFTQSDLYLTEFMAELSKRKDLVRSIQILETKTEKVGKKKDKEALVGYLKIFAKRPGGASDLEGGIRPIEQPKPEEGEGEQEEGSEEASGSKKKKRKA